GKFSVVRAADAAHKVTDHQPNDRNCSSQRKWSSRPPPSTRPPAQHPEERLDIGIGPHISIPVEVGVAGAWGLWACPGDAPEECLDGGGGADVGVAVEVG